MGSGSRKPLHKSCLGMEDILWAVTVARITDQARSLVHRLCVSPLSGQNITICRRTCSDDCLTTLAEVGANEELCPICFGFEKVIDERDEKPTEEEKIEKDVYTIMMKEYPVGHREATRISLYARIVYRILCAVHEKHSTKNPGK